MGRHLDDDLYINTRLDRKPLPWAGFWTRSRVIAGVVLLGLLLRVWAAWQLPIDADEPVYLRAANGYAQAVRQGDWAGVLNYPQNSEHPPLVKLLYAGVILALGEQAGLETVLFFTRLVSVVFGVLAVLVAAMLNPLAGALLAVQTTVVKYTSQAYLEALPLLASLLAVYAMLRTPVRAKNGAPGRWFWVSALALGTAAAGKYAYFPILAVLLYLALVDKRFSWRDLLVYLITAGLAFLALNPALWPNPPGRLLDSFFFHVGYAQGEHVRQVGYPWYQPFIWVARSMPYQWHPDVFFYFGFDGLIFLLAAAGLPREWQNRRWLVVWLAAGMLFLLLWPSKWPQYSLVVLPAFCLAAAQTVERLYRWYLEVENTWGWFDAMLPHPSRATQIITALFLLVLFAGGLVYWVSVGLNRRGWMNLNVLNSGLPSDTVYDIAPLPDGRVLLATGRGAAIWAPPAETDLVYTVEVLNTENSGLPGNRVQALAVETGGGMWFGTQNGVAHYQDGSWQTYGPADIGLEMAQVQALALDSHDRLWIGSNTGAAAFDGDQWTAYTRENSGLISNFVLSLAVTPGPQDDWIWFGTSLGLSRLDTASGQWTLQNPPGYDRNWGGIADLLLDSQSRLWVASLGGGASVWDGRDWTNLRVNSSGLPYNTVRAVYEAHSGDFWFATALPNEAGGVLARYNGQEWTQYAARRTGYSGSETLVISQDAEGQLWFGTYTAGADLYRPPR